jgi:hypothetical protein
MQQIVREQGKIIERVHPHIFWSGCLVHTLNLLMHDIVKHKDVDGLMTCTREGRNSSNLSPGIQGSITFMALTLGCKLLKIAKTRFGSYFLTFRCLLRVRQALGAMVMSDDWDDLSTDRDGANAVKETVLDSHFWSQVRYVLQFSKPIYNMIWFADSRLASHWGGV